MLKKHLLLFVMILSGVTLFVSCSGDSAATDPTADPEIDIIFPNGGDTLQLGVPYTIKWSDNVNDKVDIGIYRGLSTSAVLVEEFTNISGTEYQFTVPVNWNLSADYSVRVTSAADTSVYDTSDDYFRIVEYTGDGNDEPSSATDLTIPHEGDYAIYDTGDVDWYRVYLNEGQRYHFENSSELNFDSVFRLYTGNTAGNDIVSQVAYNDDGGESLQPYIDYTAPEQGYYFLRVAHYSNDPAKTKQADTGYYTLSITEHIFLETPDGGEVWMMGTSHGITWDAEVPGDVDLGLVYPDGYVSHIATVSAASNLYTWTLPSNIDAGSDFRIRVANHSNPDSYDESDHYFCISEDTYVDITGEWYMNGTWAKWETMWEFSSNGTWTNDFSESGNWTLAGNGLRWTYYDGESVYIGLVEGDMLSGTMSHSENNADGTWYGHRILKLLTPNGNEVFQASDQVNITWEEGLSASHIEIDLYKDDVFCRSIETVNIDDHTFFNWTVPADLTTSTKYKIRINSSDAPEINDESNDYFTIDGEENDAFIIDEDFDDGVADGWTGVSGIWSVANYVYNVSSGTYSVSTSYYGTSPEGNYVFEADARKTAGSSPNYGIIINGDHSNTDSDGDWTYCNMFFITTDGLYQFASSNNGVWSSTGWIESSDIVKGLGSWNNLKVIVDNSGSYYHIFINGVYQISVNNNAPASQREVGLKMYDGGEGPAGTGEFDNIKLYNINKSFDTEFKIITKRLNPADSVNR